MAKAPKPALSINDIRRQLTSAYQNLTRSHWAATEKPFGLTHGGPKTLQQQAQALLLSLSQGVNALLSRIPSLSIQTPPKEAKHGSPHRSASDTHQPHGSSD